MASRGDTINDSIDRIFAVCAHSGLGPTVLGQAREVFEYRRSFLLAADDLSALAQDAGKEQIREMFELIRRQTAMLRATIVFTDQLHGDVLCVVTGDADATVTQILSNNEHRARFAALDRDALLQAYRLRVFRNKLVTHPPGELLGSSTSTVLDETARQLQPIRWGEEIPDETIEQIHSLAREAEHDVLGVADELSGAGNVWNLLQLLFDSVAPLEGSGERSNLRMRVDSLVGKLGGVKSPTMAEVIDAMVAFLAALAELVESEHAA